MNIDEPLFTLSDVARVAHLDARTVSNWTNRGLADAYGNDQQKRGRGLARTYTMRDTLRFAAMADLAKISISLPVGTRICKNVFGEAFRRTNPGCYVVEAASMNALSPKWYPDVMAVLREAKQLHLGIRLIIDAATIFANVEGQLELILERRSELK